MGWTARDIPDLTGRVAVVTGASGGLGLETTKALARHGCRVVMAARNPRKADQAVTSVLRADPSASLDLRPLDLASLDSVRTFAAAVTADYPVVDLLVNNAGVMGIPRQVTTDGFEMQFGVNHLGHFVLTALLMSRLLSADRARVVTVSSSGRFLAPPFDPTDPHLTRAYDPWKAYGQSKRANADFALELHRRLGAAGARVQSFTADPGFAATDLQANSARVHAGASQRFFHRAVMLVGATPLTGALPQLRAACDPAAVGGSMYGLRFLVYGAPVRVPSGQSAADKTRRRLLWEVSERDTGTTFDVEAMVAAHAAGQGR